MNNKDLIYVLDKRMQLYQAPFGFRTSMDSVMLAAACPVKAGQSVLDLGCGVGSAGLCVLYRVKEASLLGVDIQEDHVKLAEKNAELNDMAQRSSFLCSDIRDLQDIGTFNHVICNPPYKEAGAHNHSPSPARARAMGHIDEDMSLAKWIESAWEHIKGQGSFTIIHEAGQCDAICHHIFRRFGNTEIIPVYTKPEQPARRVIIRTWKHKKGEARILPGVAMYNESKADAILRNGEALFL